MDIPDRFIVLVAKGTEETAHSKHATEDGAREVALELDKTGSAWRVTKAYETARGIDRIGWARSTNWPFPVRDDLNYRDAWLKPTWPA